MNDLAGLQSGNLVALCAVTLLDVLWIAWVPGMEGGKDQCSWSGWRGTTTNFGK